MGKNRNKVEALLTDLAKQLQVLRRRRLNAIERADSVHKRRIDSLNSSHDEAEFDWWATIPKDMQPLVEETLGRLETECSTAQQTPDSKTSD